VHFIERLYRCSPGAILSNELPNSMQAGSARYCALIFLASAKRSHSTADDAIWLERDHAGRRALGVACRFGGMPFALAN